MLCMALPVHTQQTHAAHIAQVSCAPPGTCCTPCTRSLPGTPCTPCTRGTPLPSTSIPCSITHMSLHTPHMAATYHPRRGTWATVVCTAHGAFPCCSMALSPGSCSPRVTVAVPAPSSADPKGFPAALRALHPICPKEDPASCMFLTLLPPAPSHAARAVPLTPPRCCSQAWATG